MRSTEGPWWSEAVAIVRGHIIGVAMAATLVFRWIMSGRYDFELAALVGIDWFLINLLNRVTDIDEDLRNRIPGTERVARRRVGVVALSGVVFAASFVWSQLRFPALLSARIAVQCIGIAYNFKVIPSTRGRTRFKEMYFFKNFMSAVLFVLTCFVYPWLLGHDEARTSFAAVAWLVAFFVPFELTYEVLYDLRDIEGDRAEHVPTYPVVHGATRARQIIDGLLIASALALIAGFVARRLGVRELLMLCAPALQFVLYRPRFRRGLTPRDCILITHAGTAQLLAFAAGTALWQRAGLPANVFL